MGLAQFGSSWAARFKPRKKWRDDSGGIRNGNRVIGGRGRVEDDRRNHHLSSMMTSVRWPGRLLGASVLARLAGLGDDNLDIYWQSEGAQPHLVNIQHLKKVKLQLAAIFVDFNLDESYSRSKISIRARDGFHNLKEKKTVELVKPIGWVHIPLSENDPRNPSPSSSLRETLSLTLP